MEFDQTAVEHFLADYFRERTSALRLRLQVHRLFWERFYDTNCQFDSRRGVIAQSEAERILSVSTGLDGALVITTGESIYRSCYDIRPHQERWLIHEVDMECAVCQVQGVNRNCAYCGGAGWLAWKDRLRLFAQPRGESAPLDTEPEAASGQRYAKDVEKFMADHFRERALAHGKELHILASLALRFCSSDCEWKRWGPSAEDEAERILTIEPASNGVHVISNGSHGLRRRYHLQQNAGRWQILEVDMECLHCHRNGPSANCFVCGGTTWGHSRLRTQRDRTNRGDDEAPLDVPRW